MSHGFYSQTPHQQYPPQPYAQPQAPYPNLDRTSQAYSAPGHSPQAAPPTGYFPSHGRSASEFAGTPQPYTQPPYPAQGYASYGQQPPAAQQPPFSPFTQPPASSYGASASGYQHPVAAQPPQPSPSPPRVQHQHSHSVPAAYPPTSSAFSSYGSPTQPTHTQQGSFAGRPSTTPATNGYNQFGARPDSMPPPARSATAASSYAQQSEFGQSYRGTASTLPRNSFVPTTFGSRARSASPLPPTAYGDLARAPTVASTKSLDSGLVNKRPLPSAPGIGAAGSLSSVRERTSMYEVDTRVKDFAYPGRESPTKAFGASSPTKSGYIPYKREETSALPSYPSTSTVAGTSSKPTYAAQPSVNPRTAPFDPFGASNIAQLASSPPKTFTSSFGRNDSPTRALPPPASAPAPGRSWAQEKASLSKPKSDLPLVTPLPLTAPALPARRPAPPFAPSYKRPDPVLPPYSPPKPAPAALADDRDWESKEREWTRERDRAEEAIARAREAGRSFLQEQVGVPEVRSEAAAIAEEYLARRALEAAKTKPTPERRSQTVDSYTSAPPTRRFEPPERRPNDTWGSPSRKDRWGEPKGDYTDYRPKQSQSPTRRAESPERANHAERRGGYASPERRASPANSSGPLPKSRSQKAFPSDGDYVQHRTRETFRSNGASPTRHQAQASEPTRPARNDLYDSQDDYDAREEYDARPSLQGMSRRERDDEEFHERRSPERAPPPSRGNPGTSHVQTRTEPRPMPREPPRTSPPRSQYSSPERQQPRPQSRSQPQQQPPQQPQRPMSSASPATSPRAPAASQKPAMAPYQSMAMKIAAQALADETKVWPSEVPQLPRAPGRQETNARQEYEPPRTPVGTRPPVDDVSPPPSDLESEYDEPERQWTEPAPASPRREPATPVRREPATPTRREPATPTRREPATPTRRQPAPMRRDSVPVSPRREPVPASPRREPAPAPVRREPPAPASPKRQQPVRGPPQPRDIPQEDDYEYDMPRRQPSRNQPPPQRAMPQEDEYEYYDDEPPEQWREPAPKAKVADVAPKREPLRENTQPAFNRPRPPARSTSRDAPRREPSRDAALRRPVPPPPAAVPAPAPAPAPLARQPPPPPVSRQPPPPPPPRSPSPVQMQGPTINFPDDDEYDNPPAPGLPTFSFDNVDEPAGPSINVTSEYDSEPSGPRIQVEEIPSISIIENSAPQIELPQEEDQRESPVRRGGGGGLRCAGCDGAIAGRIVSAMGVRWHPHCFKCDDCGTLLEHVSSYEHKGKAYCHLDYHDRFAPRCFHCKTPIVDERFIALDDPALGGQRYYHELHFFCAECGDPFLDPSASSAAPPAARGQVFGEGDGDDDVGFTVFNGHPYCEPCHVRLRMPRCGTSAKSGRAGPPGVGCGKPIREEAIEALGRKWHWKCFTCDSCKKPFEDPSFFQREDAAFCDPCYRILLKNEF